MKGFSVYESDQPDSIDRSKKLSTNHLGLVEGIMNYWSKIISFGLVVLALMLLGACNLPQSGSPTPGDPAVLYTAAAQTVSAQITMQPVSTQAPLPSVTLPVILPSLTVLPSQTPLPSNTSAPPPATSIPIPCDRGSFVEDVSYPDNTEVAINAQFIKTWRLKNNGSCTWNSNYALVFVRGDSIGGPASVQFTSGSVAPGQTVDVSVSLVAPSSTGTYQGYWKLRNSAGVVFGVGADAGSEFWVKIKTFNPVPTSSPTPKATLGFDFIDKGPSAEWRNTTTQIPWGDPPEDNPGVAVSLDSSKLENGKTYNRVLATWPELVTDGFVRGLYSSYTVQTGDRFRTLLGFRESCGSAKARWQFIYKEGANETVMAEWLKICDGNVLTIDQDLASLVGKTVQFILVVKAEGDPGGDRAMWVNPRIER